MNTGAWVLDSQSKINEQDRRSMVVMTESRPVAGLDPILRALYIAKVYLRDIPGIS